MGQMGQMGIWEGHMSLQARSNVSNGSNSPPDTCGGPLVPALRKISKKKIFPEQGTNGTNGCPGRPYVPYDRVQMGQMGPERGAYGLPKKGHMGLLKRVCGGLLDPFVTGPEDKWVK